MSTISEEGRQAPSKEHWKVCCVRVAVACVLAATVTALSAVPTQAVIIWGQNPTADQTGYGLDEVLAANGIRVGDKLFDQFSVQSAVSSGVFAVAPDSLDEIAVTGIIEDGGSTIGLKFNSFWYAESDGVQTSLADTVIRFKVTVDPGFKINKTELRLTSSSVAPIPNAVASITEDVFAADGVTNIGDMFVKDSTLSGLDNIDDNMVTPARSMLWVEKDIAVFANGNGATATISSFEQRFYQVPEPASLALLITGSLLTLSQRKYRSRR